MKEVGRVHAYCLFCETQRCGIIAESIRKQYGYTCFYPRIIQRKWIRGVATEESHDWLPGYVFIYTEQPAEMRFDIPGIIRRLGNGELEGGDLAFAEMIHRQKGIMGIVPLLREGDRCRISDPAWNEVSGRIIKMDRERKRCCVEFVFEGITRTIWAGYELTEAE